MAGHRTKSAESGASTDTQAASVLHTGASSSESMLWAPALLSAGDEGSTSSTFRLPELAASAEAHAGSQPQFQQNLFELWLPENVSDGVSDQLTIVLPPLTEAVDTMSNAPNDDLGVYMRYRCPVTMGSMTSTADANFPLTSAPFETNSLPPATLHYHPPDDVVHSTRMPSSEIIDAANDCATLDRTEISHAYQPLPGNQTPQIPAFVAPNALPSPQAMPAHNHDGGNPLLRPPAWEHEHGLACPRRSHSTSDRGAQFRVMARPAEDTTTQNALVPYASVVAMPTIGNVGAFMRTLDSFQELTGAPPAQAPAALHFDAPMYQPLPALPLPRPSVTDLSAPHRYPRLIAPRPRRTAARTGLNHNQPLQAPIVQRPWERTDLAAYHAPAMWNRPELDSSQARYVQISDPRPAPLYRNYYLAHQAPRTCTRGLTFTSAAATMTGSPTPVQRPAANCVDGPALNMNWRQPARPGTATDAQSANARRRRNKISERMQILRRLIPSGTEVGCGFKHVDLATMLTEAFNYLNFLKQQHKLLMSENWRLATPNVYRGKPHNLWTHVHRLELERGTNPLPTAQSQWKQERQPVRLIGYSSTTVVLV